MKRTIIFIVVILLIATCATAQDLRQKITDKFYLIAEAVSEVSGASKIETPFFKMGLIERDWIRIEDCHLYRNIVYITAYDRRNNNPHNYRLPWRFVNTASDQETLNLFFQFCNNVFESLP